jgi:hypothetical protein
LDRFRRRGTALLAAVALGLVGAAAPTSLAAAPAAAGATVPQASSAQMLQGAHRVTLLTGDVVSLCRLAGGKPGVAVEPAARPDGRGCGR